MLFSGNLFGGCQDPIIDPGRILSGESGGDTTVHGKRVEVALGADRRLFAAVQRQIDIRGDRERALVVGRDPEYGSYGKLFIGQPVE